MSADPERGAERFGDESHEARHEAPTARLRQGRQWLRRAMWRGRAADCERRAGCWRFGNRGCHWRYGCLVSLGHCETQNQRIRREASGLYSQPQPTRHPSRTIRRPYGIKAASTWRELTSARHQIGGVRFLRLWSPCVHAGILTKLKTLGIVGIPRVLSGADDGSRTRL